MKQHALSVLKSSEYDPIKGWVPLLCNFQPTSYSLTFAAKWIQSPVNYSEWDSGGIRRGKTQRATQKGLERNVSEFQWEHIWLNKTLMWQATRGQVYCGSRNKLILIQLEKNMLLVAYISIALYKAMSVKLWYIWRFWAVFWNKK